MAMPNNVACDGRDEPRGAAPCEVASLRSTNNIRRTASSLDYLLRARTTQGIITAPDRAIVEHLEQKAVRVAELVNSRDFDLDHWSDLYAEDFYGVNGTREQGFILGLEACVQSHKEYARRYPGWHFHIEDQSVHLDTRKGTASVWLRSRVTGNPAPVQTANVAHLTFEREDDGRVWRIVRLEGLSGYGGFDE